MKPVPGKDLAQSMVKMHVDRFSLPDIASDSDVLGKLLAIKFTLADIYTTDELLSLFFDLTFGAIPAKRAIFFWSAGIWKSSRAMCTG
jgi:hypothetical protein